MSPSCEGHRVMRVKLKAAYCPPSPLLFLLESDDVMLYDISCRNFFVRFAFLFSVCLLLLLLLISCKVSNKHGCNTNNKERSSSP